MASKLEFPRRNDDYMGLADSASKKGEYDNAVMYAYKAMAGGADGDRCVIFIARQLMLSENYNESLRMLLYRFPDTDTRPYDAYAVMRDCYYGLHEYIHAHSIEIELKARGEKLPDMSIPDSVENLLMAYDLVLNDTVAFGFDDSALTEIWCDIRPVTCIPAVQNAFMWLSGGEFDRCFDSLYVPVRHCIYTDDSFIAEDIVKKNLTMYVIACVMSEKDAGMLESVTQIVTDGAEVSPALRTAITLLSQEETENVKLPDEKDLSNEDLLSLGLLLMSRNMREEGCRYVKRLLSLCPYNIGLNRMAAFCAWTVGDYDLCADAYKRMNRMIPDSFITRTYRDKTLEAKKTRSAGDIDLLPLCPHETDFRDKEVDRITEEILVGTLKRIEKNLTEEAADVFAEEFPMLKENVQDEAVRKLCTSQSDVVWMLLRKLLLDNATSLPAKEKIFKAMIKKGVKGKTACCVNGNFIEAVPYLHTDLPLPEKFASEYKLCYNIAVRNFGNICAHVLNYYYEYFSQTGLRLEEPGFARGFAAVMLSMALRVCGYDTDFDELIEKHFPNIDPDIAADAAEMADSCERGFLYDFYSNV